MKSARSAVRAKVSFHLFIVILAYARISKQQGEILPIYDCFVMDVFAVRQCALYQKNFGELLRGGFLNAPQNTPQKLLGCIIWDGTELDNETSCLADFKQKNYPLCWVICLFGASGEHCSMLVYDDF